MEALQYDYVTFLMERIKERVTDDDAMVFIDKLADVVDAIYGESSPTMPQRTTPRRTVKRSTATDGKKDAE